MIEINRHTDNLSCGEVARDSTSTIFVPLTTGSEADAWLTDESSSGREPSLMTTPQSGRMTAHVDNENCETSDGR